MKGAVVPNPMPAEYSLGFPQAADANTMMMTAQLQPEGNNGKKVTLTEDGRLFVPGPGAMKARLAALDAHHRRSDPCWASQKHPAACFIRRISSGP